MLLLFAVVAFFQHPSVAHDGHLKETSPQVAMVPERISGFIFRCLRLLRLLEPWGTPPKRCRNRASSDGR